MSATGYTPIQLYYSTTSSAVPVNTNLLDGELAINIADGKLFYKDGGGVVQIIATKGTGAIGGSNNQVQYNSSGALAGSANFTFDGTTATINALNLTSALGVAYGGTGLTSGTSGGVLYYSASGTLASSGVLSASSLIVGGGAGVAPSSITTGTGVVTAIGNNSNSANGLAVLNASGYLAVGQGGTGLGSGTSGGVLYYSASNTLASSAALTANALVIGGGAGVAPSTTTTGTGVLTALGNNANASGGFATIDGIATLTNKRIDPRVSSTASTASITPDIASYDQYCVTAQAAALAINAPTGTPVDGNKLIFRLLDNGVSRAITWDGTYTVIGVTLPTATTAGKMTYVGCIYNVANTRWDVIAVTTQA